MPRTRRATDQLVGGPLDGMTVAIGPGRTLLVPLRLDGGVRMVAECSRPLASGPFYWTRWAPGRIA